MRVIIAGWREFNDYELLKQVIKEANFDITTILSGCARGADALGERYAIENKIELEEYPADWNGHGKRAGIIRNEVMACNADALIAILSKQSIGTLDMIKRAVNKGLIIHVYQLSD